VDWTRKSTKSNGELRRQFSQWQVPSELRGNLGLQDGDKCSITVAMGKFRHGASYMLTSGGEFRLPNAIAEHLRGIAQASPGSAISFRIDSAPSVESLEKAFTQKVAASSRLTSSERKKRLASAPKFPEQHEVVVTTFLRNPDVVAECLARASGVCESCRANAPFDRASNGTPYLEIHHKKRLADGGADTAENALALCPNCHRRAHFG
jgi:predicted HNH restriction endonuclease